MEMNKHVRAELHLFTKGVEKKFFRQSYVRSGKYRPLIVSKLKEAGIPEELSWLPLIESGFKVKAMSKARALGLWQFIPSTGYKFGLKRNQYIDERIDPVKSTDAAIAYLKELHQIFGDWTTVLAAYNCGEGRVLRVIRSQNVNYLDNFWDLYARLPRETARYVPRFLATIHIIKNSESYGIDAIATDKPLDYEIVEVNRQVQITDIAKKINVSGKRLKELNPELRYNILPPEKYALKVPPAKADLLLAAIDTIPISYPPRPAYVVHRVRRGETLSGIAQRYRTSVGRIMRANNIRKSSYIVAGKKLKIPQRGTVITRADTSVKVSTGSTFVHTVRSGDSLWNLAKRYGTTTKKIQNLNGMHTTKLFIGQKLTIPEYRIVQSSAKTAKNQYLVRRGDSPYKIATRHNMSLANFLRINDLTPRSKIYPGQLLLVE
jgi:membrane-bound lytic murein transglycosylase D